MAHQIDESKPKYLSQTRFMSGRRIIKTSVTEITDENVVDVLRKIHPQLAFQHSGMFSDAESAYNMSMKYYEEQQEKAAELAKKTAPDDSGDDDNDPDNNDI